MSPPSAFTLLKRRTTPWTNKIQRHPRYTAQHSYQRDLVTKLIGTHEAEVIAIDAQPITIFEKIQLLEALQEADAAKVGSE
jgi:hypothetical protein